MLSASVKIFEKTDYGHLKVTKRQDTKNVGQETEDKNRKLNNINVYLSNNIEHSEIDQFYDLN